MQNEFHYLRYSHVQQMLGGVSRSTVHRMVAAGRLPKPYQLGVRFVAWRSDELKTYLESKEHTTARYASSAS